jgi:hypothetical protein
MVTIDLTTPPPPPTHLLEGLPRRVALTLPELRLVAQEAGGAPLPFDLTDVATPSSLDSRLGMSAGSAEDNAYAAAIAALHDPADSLARRGMSTDEGIDPGLVGAVGLLATPELALEIDIATAGGQVKAWHRMAGGAVATLATVDGVVFELAWFGADQWTGELARVAVVPEDARVSRSAVPDVVLMPFPLADSAGEALRSGRADLVQVLVGQRSGHVTTDGEGHSDAAATTIVGALHNEAQGRLRVLAARIGDEGTTAVGVVSWVLLADGWHALLPHQEGPEPFVEVRLVSADDLAAQLAPVLAEVVA